MVIDQICNISFYPYPSNKTEALRSKKTNDILQHVSAVLQQIGYMVMCDECKGDVVAGWIRVYEGRTGAYEEQEKEQQKKSRK